MPAGNHTLGRDLVVNLTLADGTPFRIKTLTNYTMKQKVKDDMIEPLDGRTIPFKIPQGWSGTLSFDRQDSTVDDYIAKWEAEYHAGRNTPNATMTETITNPDGSKSQFRLTEVAFHLEDAGDRQSKGVVKGRIAWEAARRIKVR